MGIIITDRKSHQEALKQSKEYADEGEKYFDPLIDWSLERPKTLLVTRIDSMKNCGRQLVNDVYVIYAEDEEGKAFKILSHEDRNEKRGGKRIKVNAKYRMKLDLHLFSSRKDSVQRSYYGNIIYNEPEKGLYNLYVTGNLNGLSIYPYKRKMFYH